MGRSARPGEEPRLHRVLPALSIASALSAMTVGALVLVGWVARVAWLRQPFPALPAMTPVSAALILLAGGAFLLLRRPPPAGPRGGSRLLGIALSLGCALLALATVVSYAAGRDLGLDGWLGAAPTKVNPFGSRPALNTAVAYLLFATALLFLERRTPRAPWVAGILALASGTVALVSLAGFVYGEAAVFSAPRLFPRLFMAPHTALVIELQAVAIVCARPDQGIASIITSRGAGGALARRLLLRLIGLAVIGALIEMGEQAGVYGAAFASALLIVVGLVASFVVILVTAAWLDRVDAERARGATQLRQLFEQAADGIFLADLEGRYTQVNQAGARILGYRPEEIVGKTIVDFIAPEDVPRLWQERERLLGDGSELNEWKLRRADGTWVETEVSATILPDGRWQGLVRDITERAEMRRAGERAVELERKLRGELEAVSSASSAVSDALAAMPETSLESVLQVIAFEARVLTGARYAAVGIGDHPNRPFDPWIFLGASAEDAAGRGFAPRPVGVLGRVARGGETVRTRELPQDARWLPPEHAPTASFLGVPIRFRGRAVASLYLADKVDGGEFTDTDERVVGMLAARGGAAIEAARLYAAEALQRSWLQTVVEQLPEGLLLLDERGRVFSMNRSAEALASPPTGAVDPWGNPVRFDVRWPSGTPVAFEDLPLVRALVRGQTTLRSELMLRQADGRFVPVMVSASPVRAADGRIHGAVLIIQDISTLKELERLREEWTAVVAHDLRQPVSTISLAAEVLALVHQGPLPPAEARAIERIRRASGRLARMVGDLVDLSRLEARRMKLERRVVDVADVVHDTIDHMADALGGRRVAVAAAPAAAFVDPGRVEQVLSNLVANAVKYGDPEREIRVEVVPRAGEIEIVVTNQGAGIPADELPNLFRRFHRASGAGAVPGLGLGLYICKGLVEAHGGRIWAESTPGEETRFHFTVPAPSRPAEREPAPGPPT